MSKCDNCGSCSALPILSCDIRQNYVLVGNMNVGKSTLFSRMCRTEICGVNIPGNTVTIKRGAVKGQKSLVFDTPGIHSIFSADEDERASRDILLSASVKQESLGIIMVADAKNLKHSIAIALQYAEYGLPMLLNVNMIDEAASRGIEIDFKRLSAELGVEVSTTIAREGIGVQEMVAKLVLIHPPERKVKYSERIERFLAQLGDLLADHRSLRALGLLLLAEDQGVEIYIKDNFGGGMFDKVRTLAAESNRQASADMGITLGNLYHQRAARIVGRVQRKEELGKNPFILTLGDWCTKTSTGIPIAMLILAAMYLFVGSFGATFLVDSINGLFVRVLIPWFTDFLQPIPIIFIKDMLVDPEFGILPTGVFLAVGLVMPVIFCFYIAFGVLEDSGYLPRISILLDRVFQKMGLNGKGVIPLVMGFSCVTMAILTTRVLNTEKEKNIASFLLVLCMPCAPLIAVMLIILNKMPLSATMTVFGVIFLQILIAGFLADKILPGGRTPLILEIPAMRLPKHWQVIKMASVKTYFFMKEAIPVFVYASMVVFIFQRIGGLELLEKALGPIIGKIMGLPDKSVQVFIKTIIRRESGAVELEHLSGIYTNLQLVVNLLVMTSLTPCINAAIVLFKERGGKAASAILVTVFAWAIIMGSVVNYLCRTMNITFT